MSWRTQEFLLSPKQPQRSPPQQMVNNKQVTPVALTKNRSRLFCIAQYSAGSFGYFGVGQDLVLRCYDVWAPRKFLYTTQTKQLRIMVSLYNHKKLLCENLPGKGSTESRLDPSDGDNYIGTLQSYNLSVSKKNIFEEITVYSNLDYHNP